MVVQKRSYGSVQRFSLDKARAIRELRRVARRLVADDPRVEVVVLFGSLAQGRALPGSDADLLLVLREHRLERWCDRIPEYLLDVPMPVEVFPYTWEEVQRVARKPGLIRAILGEYVPLAGRPAALARLRALSEGTAAPIGPTAEVSDHA